MATLFDPLRIGDLDIPNRILMAPLTRRRAQASCIPGALMAEYYRQRATAGLILSEATVVMPSGIGYANTAGIWSAGQVQGWQQVTHAVHEAGGRMFLQLWHVGRISHPMLLDGQLPVAPSALAPEGNVRLLRPETPYVVPRALRLDEIPGIIDAFRRGAENAQSAGFDGVEIHAANGYLLDQFLQDSSNHRTDEYGGPIEHRARLLLEVTDAAISVWGAGRVGVHLAPRGDVHFVGDSSRAATFGYVAHQLKERGIAFICVREYVAPDSIGAQLKEAFGGVYVANEKLSFESAQAQLLEGKADAGAFGRSFLANPDLPRRVALGAPLNEPQPATFYTHGPEGYTDYPALP